MFLQTGDNKQLSEGSNEEKIELWSRNASRRRSSDSDWCVNAGESQAVKKNMQLYYMAKSMQTPKLYAHIWLLNISFQNHKP